MVPTHNANTIARLCVVLLVIVCSTGGGAWPFAKGTAWHQRLSVEDALLERIEQFREQMPCGIDGGPPLAPYELAEQDLTFDVPGTIR